MENFVRFTKGLELYDLGSIWIKDYKSLGLERIVIGIMG